MRYTGEKAREVLAYLLTEASYNPGIEWDIDGEGHRVYRDLDYYLEHGYPKKPRYKLGDGDYAENIYGYGDGYHYDGKRYIAFDNTSGNCNVEEFELEEDALKWLNHECEDASDFKGKTSLG